MRPTLGLTAAAGLLMGSIAIGAQAPPAGGRTAGPGPARQGGPGQTFPAQQRPPADPAHVARGSGLYGVHCRACHGADLRGGDIGGPNLLRSQTALNDQDGELIGPIIVNGRLTPGMPTMPPLAIAPDDIKAIAAYIHSVQATMRGQGSPPAGEVPALNILVGDAAAGRVYFDANCATCHSPTGDLRGVASATPDPTQLQNLWVAGGRGGRGASPNAPDRRQVRVTVTVAGGQTIQGRLDRIDDFLVVLTTADGAQRSFSRTTPGTTVAVSDPLAEHRRLLGVYADRDIHNVTAYLVTLK